MESGSVTVEPGLVERFKAEAQKFYAAFNRLLSMKNDVAAFPQLQKEYDSLVSKGQALYNTVKGAANAVDTAWHWFTSAFGMEGVDYARERTGQLSALPVVIGAATIAALVWFVKSVYEFERKLHVLQQAQETGQTISPELRQFIGGESGFFPIVKKLALPALILGGGWYLYKQFTE